MVDRPLAPADPIAGPARGNPTTVLPHAPADRHVRLYLAEAYRLGPLVGFDPAILVAQSHLETNGWRSEAWTKRRNPAGIGILGDPGQADQDLGYSWADGTAAARGQIAHMTAYVWGDAWRAHWPAAAGLGAPWSYDPRWQAVFDRGWDGTVATIADLTGTWATDPDYAEKICRRGNELFGFEEETPVSDDLTFGRVPRPTIVPRLIPDADNWAWDNLGQRDVYGVVYHTQVGKNWGTDGWFRTLWQPNGQKGGGQLGLTDYGITRQGDEILQWNDPWGRAATGVSANRSPWASGPWEAPPGGDGHAFVARYGSNGINRYLVALEVDQFYDTPFTNAGWETLVALSAWLADQAKVPWRAYPLNPRTGLTFTYTHDEFQAHKPCAGGVILDRIDELIGATKERLRTFQTWQVEPAPDPPEPPRYVRPVVPSIIRRIPWPQEVVFNGQKMQLMTDWMRADKAGIKVYATASERAQETRKPLSKGEEFAVVYGWGAGDRRWGITPYGSRILLNGCTRLREWIPEQAEAPATGG